MRLLLEAGDAGMDVGTIVRRFTYPVSMASRNARANDVLRRLARLGYLRRSEGKEPSVHYHNTPQYRWFITGKGREWVAANFQSLERRQVAERKAAREYGQLLLEKAMARYQGSSAGVLRAERHDVIMGLRKYYVTWRECGAVFGLTGEMARLIAGGYIYSREYRRQEADITWLEEFRNAVRDQLRETGATQKMLAGVLGVTESQMSYAMNGGLNSPMTLLTRVAEASGLRIVVEKDGTGILTGLARRAAVPAEHG